MKTQVLAMFVASWMLLTGLVVAGDVQWVRVTVLLERGDAEGQQTAESLIRGGIYSLDEVERRGQDAIDREIVDRVRFLAGEMHDVRQSMRLGDLLQRQYYLPLRLTEQAVVPVIDLNPRLGITIEPQRFAEKHVVCKIRFLEPEGASGPAEYSGEPITLTLKDAKLTDVIRTFSVLSEKDIVTDGQITGTVTLDLRDVPWDQAFDLVLRTNGYGWTVQGDHISVSRLDEMSRRRRVRTEATINLPRTAGESATIASRGDEQNRTVVLVLESVEGEPGLVTERDGLLHPPALEIVIEKTLGDGPMDDVLVFRALATEKGDLKNFKVLNDPIRIGEKLEPARSWYPWTVLDEQGRRTPAVVGFGLRLKYVPTDDAVLTPVAISGGLRIELEVGPLPVERGGGDPDLYLLSAYVKRVEDGEIISAPRISGRRGEEAKIRSSVPGEDGRQSLLEMSFLVSEDGTEIEYSWTLSRDGVVLEAHRADLKF